MPSVHYLTAAQAADMLGISLATLYAYVSRGFIRSVEAGEAKRTRRYLAEDVLKLKARKEGRRSPEKVAEGSLFWGEPVLESALTLIQDGRLYYRGLDVESLVRQHSIEDVAAWLWTGDMSRVGSLFAPSKTRIILPQLEATLSLVEQFQALLPLAAAADLAAYDLRPAVVPLTGARLLWLLVSITTRQPQLETSIAATLARVWSPGDPAAEALMNAALILCADHELNVSSFTARCVASSGATPYNVVTAGLAALQGAKHGGSTEQTLAFLREIGRPDNVRPVLASYLKRGERPPGFGHRLYPDGDPRCGLLFELTARAYPQSAAIEVAEQVAREVSAAVGELPTIDFALATLALVWNLPPGSGIALFALGRTIGWIAHANEQYQSDRLIRPRARYIGPPPKL